MATPDYSTKAFAAAIAYLRQKISFPTAKWDDITDDEFDALFTVAGLKGDLLDEVRLVLETAIDEGWPLDKFTQRYQQVTESWAGATPWRSRVIFLTNLRMSYAAGRYEQQLDPEVVTEFPYLQFVHSDHSDYRPTHKALDGKIFKAEEMPFYPPSGFGCGCHSKSIRGKDFETKNYQLSPIKRGDLIPVDIFGKPAKLPVEPEKGFDYIPGRSRKERREQILKDKFPSWPDDITESVKADVGL